MLIDCLVRASSCLSSVYICKPEEESTIEREKSKKNGKGKESQNEKCETKEKIGK